jgi:4-hydroxyphenylpyruvate dioxygenase-like putative hemolysin
VWRLLKKGKLKRSKLMDPNTEVIKKKLKLPDPSQICIVVRDLKKAAKYYENILGIGPFVFPKIVYDNITYLGKPSNGYWEMAFARMGTIELELSCPIKSPSIYEDFLNERGEGLHHIGFDIFNLDEAILQAEKLGIKILMSGTTSKGGFAHLNTTKIGGTIFEIIKRPAPRV